mgnify:CR=1 FL=1
MALRNTFPMIGVSVISPLLARLVTPVTAGVIQVSQKALAWELERYPVTAPTACVDFHAWFQNAGGGALQAW